MKYVDKRTYNSFDNAKKACEPFIFSDAPYIFRKRELPNGKVRVYAYEIGDTAYPQPSYIGWFGKLRMQNFYEAVHRFYSRA